MEKMLTFEEWWGTDVLDNSSVAHGYAEAAWNAARIGTIPAENAVVIPPVGEWPEWATEIQVMFHGGLTGQLIDSIPRPKPVWVPRVGEAVFTNGDDGEGVLYAVVTEVVPGEGVCVTFPDGDYGLYDLDRVKPGNMKYFGKPWSEIPGGVE